MVMEKVWANLEGGNERLGPIDLGFSKKKKACASFLLPSIWLGKLGGHPSKRWHRSRLTVIPKGGDASHKPPFSRWSFEIKPKKRALFPTYPSLQSTTHGGLLPSHLLLDVVTKGRPATFEQRGGGEQAVSRFQQKNLVIPFVAGGYFSLTTGGLVEWQCRATGWRS